MRLSGSERLKALDYEEFLKKIAALAKKVNAGNDGTVPPELKTPAQIALYNNLGKDLELAKVCDQAVQYVKKADFRGNVPKENEIKAVLYQILKNERKVEEIFLIVKQQREY